MRTHCPVVLVLCGLGLTLPSCDNTEPEPPAPVLDDQVYALAHGCFALEATGEHGGSFLESTEASYQFSAADPESAARFTMQPSDLGTFLLYDQERHYLVAEPAGDGTSLEIRRVDTLHSDVLLIDDTYESPAEWELFALEDEEDLFVARHRASGHYLSVSGLCAEIDDAAILSLHTRSGCAQFPELSVDATGTVEPRTWEDGSVFGIVETHNHLLTNFGFGGGGIFHGAPFHRLGVEHALPSCELYHGDGGRKDLVGFFYDSDVGFDMDTIMAIALQGQANEFAHHTDGYPEFTDWPNSWASSTHQTMYYRWLERAYLGGVRLLVQLATGNSVLCEMVVAMGVQQVRYSCNDMVSVDRILEETFHLERYIDAQSGGPGQGWLRIVTTPAQARQVIGEGKLAVILGIEIANIFDCFLTPREGFPICDEAYVREQLDRYHELGVRSIFPVHKYDNAFSAGDGHRAIVELGNFINSGHYSNFVEDCPNISTNFDRGSVMFGGLNSPRDEYLAPAPVDTSGFLDNPMGTLLPHLDALQEPALEGDYCQNAGLTPLGETLIHELMARGFIIEVAHLPRRALARAYEILEEHDYPAVQTHGNNNSGRIYQIGGVSKTDLGRCADPERPEAMASRLTERVALIEELGGYPAEGFGFDFNGFAGGPRPRFGENSPCTAEQSNPVTYPFQSYGGDITFTEPQLGNRAVDFNTEGMIHIGLIPELIEDARRGGVTEEQLEPLFRSAEGYLRMWELARARGAELRAEGAP